MKTYDDLLKFVQKAERDSFGFHKLSKDVALHIYEGKRQVNVCVMDRNDFPISVLNLIFDPSGRTVSAFDVKNGVAQYDRPVELKMDDAITKDSIKFVMNKSWIVPTLQAL